MTENESIKKHIEDCEHRIGNILGFMESNSDADILSCEENIAVLKEAIIALEEIQQYRAIGTVEGYERAIQSSVENYNLYRECKAKLQSERNKALDDFVRFMEIWAKKIEETRICPVCGYDTEVSDSRYRERTGIIVRNRKCLNCKREFKTVEIEREVFDRLLSSDELISGIKDFIEKGEEIDRETETTS